MRRFLPFLALLLPVVMIAQDPPPQKKGNRPPPKNLKIIKAEDIGPVMRSFTTGLGVQCTFCHVSMQDFASDDNPKKNVARMMLNMVHDVNGKFPDGKEHVTCFTCHRGANMPLTAPAAGGGKP